MRRLIIGIILFLIWGILGTWYYVNHIYPAGETMEETELQADVPEVTESPPEPIVLPEKPSKLTLYFDYNRAEILPATDLDPFFNSCRDYLMADTASCLLITGHTCSIGTDEYNMELGMRRASAVKAYFMKNGFSNSCLKVSSKGETEPAADNSTDQGRKKNRRVELWVGSRGE